MILACPYNEHKELVLELADHLFTLGKLEKAESAYTEFSAKYPGDSKIEYADYRAIMANFYLVLVKERDQTRTKKALNLAGKFLERTVYKEYRDEVEKIKLQCCSQLIDHEFTVIDFYLQRKSAKAVRKRLDYVEKEF